MRWNWVFFRLGDERDLVLEKMGTDVRGFGGSTLSAKIFELRCCIAFSSVTSFPLAPFLHFLRLGWYIAVGSNGPLKDWDLWV